MPAGCSAFRACFCRIDGNARVAWVVGRAATGVNSCAWREVTVSSGKSRGVQERVAESLTIEVRNIRDAIAPATQQAEAWLEAFEPSPKVMYLVPLAIEEIVTNCIQYGYDDAKEHTIEIALSVADGKLRMTFVDDGHSFDPLARAAPDVSRPAEEREIGGLGIHLLRTMTDEIAYERRDGTNRLTLVKRLS